MVALLLDHGAQVNAKDIHGQTPLHLSPRWEPELAELLRQRGGHDAPPTK
jgi:ankyrin repeat protein